MNNSANALKAIQNVIIGGRSMGYANADPKQIASLLDATEYLVTLYLYSEPQEFLDHLDHIANKFPECRYAAAKYRQVEMITPMEQAA